MKVLPSILAYVFFIALLAVAPAAMQYNGEAEWLVPHFWIMFILISGITFLGLAAILIVQKKNKDFYIQAFLASTTVKILACIFFIVIYSMKNKVNKYVFLVDFFYIYLLNMLFEVYVLLRNLRHKNLR
ncbi:MAG: hypothetical protein JST19_07045 [Bacteroidetes bacterium]|nr:hypothetical protein [Bacteroidota bacterium]